MRFCRQRYFMTLQAQVQAHSCVVTKIVNMSTVNTIYCFLQYLTTGTENNNKHTLDLNYIYLATEKAFHGNL